MELHEHISRLLFDHECVVVPGFGAFLTRYYPAEVNQATHMMRPPSRRVYFNKSIRENDGLLVKSISLSERRPYDMVLKAVRNEVEEWKKALACGKKLNLAGIGRLYTDAASNIQFSPSLENNYLTSSYGLSIFRSPAMQREMAIKKNIHKVIEKHSMPVKAPQKDQKETKRSRRIPWAAVLAPVIFAGIVGAGYYTYQEKGFESLSGISWLQFSRTAETEEAPKEAETATPEETTENTETKVYETSESDFSVSAEEKPEPTDVAKEMEASKAESTARAGGYHIIVGSFKDQENADSYLRELAGEGFDAYRAAGDANFHRVAIGNFSSRAQALNALDGIRQNINSQAWVYAN